MTPSQDLTEWLAAGAFVSLFYTVLFATGLLTWLMLGVVGG